jgi:hypothetical protein
MDAVGEALSIYRTLTDDRGMACSLNSLGVARLLAGRFARCAVL